MPPSKQTALLASKNRKAFPYERKRGGKAPGYVVADSYWRHNFMIQYFHGPKRERFDGKNIRNREGEQPHSQRT